MDLILTIENETSLPNGAPVSVRLAEGDNLDIGRGADLDWSLPDPSRFVSSKHCEIRYRDNGYWLYDVSTNGTYLNDDTLRMQGPHRLQHGDRVTIGPYVIFVTIEGGTEEEVAPRASPDAQEPLVPPPVITEVAPRSSASAFGLEFDRPAGFPPPDTRPAAEARMPPAAPAYDPFGGRENQADAETERPRPQKIVFRRRNDGARLPLTTPPPPDWEDERPRYSPPPDLSPDSTPAATSDSLASSPPVEPHAADAAKEPPPPAGPQPAAPAASLPPEADDDATSAEAFIRRFAQGAGIPDQVLFRRDPLELAEELGLLMNLVAENLKQLLSARSEAKRFTGVGSQTMIQALDNNPLKFAPSTEDALRIMLGPRTRGYLDAQRTLESAFRDLKTHQIKTFSAMQGAVKMLVEDLDPEEIDASIGTEDRAGGWLGNRKTRLWEDYLARWQAKTEMHSDGLLGAFMIYFAECYDQQED